MKIIRYDRRKAVAYARKWALSRNPEYYDYACIGGDCTNFASQCVYAGCGIMNYTPDYGWYYTDANNKSPSWTGVQYFYNFMTTNKSQGPFGEPIPLLRAIPGDIIQLGKSNGTWYHTLILTKITFSSGALHYKVCAHTVDSLDRDLSTYTYEKIRCIHIAAALSER